jgi:general secretion pathway protein D
MRNQSQRWIVVLILILVCAHPGVSVAQWKSDPSALELKTYSLQHVAPTEVRRMLMELIGTSASSVQVFADSRRSELVVHGDASAQRLAGQLIKQVDHPPRVKSGEGVRTLQRYFAGDGQAEALVAELGRQFGGDINATVERNRHSVLVMAAPEIHESIAALLKQLPTTGPARLSAPAAKPREIEVAKPSELFPSSSFDGASRDRVARRSGAVVTPLENITTRQCEVALSKLLGSSFQSRGDARYEYVTAAGSAEVLFQSNLSLCTVQGHSNLAGQITSLVRSLDSSQLATDEEVYRFVPLRRVRPEVLQRAIRTWKQTSQERRAPSGPADNPAPESLSPVRPVSLSAQVEETAAADEKAPVGGDELRRPSSDVTVEPLPDLDVLILRGRDPDVEELVRIIQEIERLSDETAPEIDVYYLRHVKGSALEQLIEDVLDDLTQPLQGRVSITPIVKPNALLLIGWGEAVTAAKKLIERLDRPVSPDTQMRVFALQHAPADDVSESLSDFLNGRGGLGPDVLVTVNERTNSLIVNGSPRDLEEVAALVEKLDVGSSASVNQAKMIRLRNSLAADVAETITNAIEAARGGGSGRSAALEMLLVQPGGGEVMASGLLDSVTLTPDVRTNSILITGAAETLPLVEQLIRQIDENPASTAQIKVFQISNGDATDLVTVLRSLFPDAGTSTVPQLATAEGETSTVPVRFSVDVRTNTIVATGTTGDLTIIEALLLRLDQTESEERINRVYRLKNSPATDVAQAVNDFLRSERIVSQAAPGRENPFAQIEEEVVVVPEPVRNSLIISATQRYFDEILTLVENLDDQPPQVMIQVILAEVDLDNFHEFGVELGLQDSLLFDRSLLGDLLTTTVTTSTQTVNGIVTTTQDQILGASNSPGFDFNNNPLGNSGSTESQRTAGNVAGQALSHFSLGRVNNDIGYGGLVLSASSENVSVLLRALDQSGSMEVLSRPQVMTLDNQQAFIQVGQRVPRIANSQLTQFGQINSLVLEDVGLLLGVTPRISPDGMVVMEIDAEKSEVGQEREGIPISVSTDGTVIRSPRVDVTTAQTTVSAASGQTIVIGGLITNSNRSLSKKVPWLGDLPVLGKLFRYDGYTHRRTELLIILTPHVIMGQCEAEYLKQVEMSRMSWVSGDVFEWLSTPPLEGQMLDDDGVPVIFPDEDASVPPLNVPPAPTPDLGSLDQTTEDTKVVPPAGVTARYDSDGMRPMEEAPERSPVVSNASFESSGDPNAPVQSTTAKTVRSSQPAPGGSDPYQRRNQNQRPPSGRSKLSKWFGGSK